MNRLHVMEGPGDLNINELDNLSAGIMFLADYAKANPGASVQQALWGPAPQTMGFSLKKIGRVITRAVTAPVTLPLKVASLIPGPVGNAAEGMNKAIVNTGGEITATYARDITRQPIGVTLGRVGAAIATGGTSEILFASQATLKTAAKALQSGATPAATAAIVNNTLTDAQKNALGAMAGLAPQGAGYIEIASAVQQVNAAGSTWKGLQDQAKSIAFAKIMGIPVGGLVAGGILGVGIYYVAKHNKNK